LNVQGDGAPPAARPGWIPLLSLLAGLGLVAIGLALVVGYIRATFADLSMLFWGLVLPGIGVPLLALGIGMLLLARHARRSPAALRVAKRALWALAIGACMLALVGHLRWRQQQAGFAESSRQMQLDTARARDARRLQPLALTLQPDALLVQAQPTPGLDGDYRWTLQVVDGSTTLFGVSRVLSLHGASAAIGERIAFPELFRKCFAPAPLPSYACVAHAGSDNLLEVRGRLQLLANPSGSLAASRARTPPPAAVASRQLRIETFNTGNAIQIRQMALEPR
jgi:hypothetical protein